MGSITCKRMSLIRLQLSTSLPQALDLVLYCLSPSERSREAYRQTYVQGLANTLVALKNSPSLKRLFFVSSTSVYHQDDGSIVSEHSQTKSDFF